MHIPVQDYLYRIASKFETRPGLALLRKRYRLPEGGLAKAFLQRVSKQAEKRGLEKVELGVVGDYPILLFKPKHKVKGPRLLIASGFHGNECASPFAILEYLDCVKKPSNAFVSFIPLVNPRGFQENVRRNTEGGEPNRHYTKKNDKEICPEDKILKDHMDMLKGLGKDGIITLHEDSDVKIDTYAYLYGGKKHKKLTEYLVRVLHLFFNTKSDGSEVGGGAKTKEAVYQNEHDTSFEEEMSKLGVEPVITTETPGGAGFEQRVKAGAVLIETFIGYSLK